MAKENTPTREEIERYARQLGLVNLTPEQMDEFVAAGEYMRGMLVNLPRDLALDEEPAHVFLASPEA